MDILFTVIKKSEKLNKVPAGNHEMRREVLTNEFFIKILNSVTRGLL